MGISISSRPALLLIDLQKGFEDIPYWGGERNNPDAEVKAARLLNTWRELGLPVFHIRHCSTFPRSPLQESKPGNAFMDAVYPVDGEIIISKKVNSAFIGTPLQQLLDQARITQLVMAGLTTDHCISTSTRMAGNLGYDCYLVEDATATFNKTGIAGQNFPAELIHQTALASLKEEFASIVSADFIRQQLINQSKGELKTNPQKV